MLVWPLKLLSISSVMYVGVAPQVGQVLSISSVMYVGVAPHVVVNK